MIYLKLSDELVSCGNELWPYNFFFFTAFHAQGSIELPSQQRIYMMHHMKNYV